jgi:predicted nucleic-acid-binding Zn-ribbon protein
MIENAKANRLIHQCPKCGKFLKQIIATVNGNEEITQVTGICHTHHKVEIKDWNYDEFVDKPIVQGYQIRETPGIKYLTKEMNKQIFGEKK